MDFINVENIDFSKFTFNDRCHYLYEYAIYVDYDYYKTEALCQKMKMKGFFSSFNLRWYIKETYGYKYINHCEIYSLANKIVNKRKESKIEADKIKNDNPALLKHGIEFKGFWRNEEEKIIVLKYVLDIYNRFTYRAPDMLMEEFNTSHETINKIYNEAINVLVLKDGLASKADIMNERRKKAEFDKKMDTNEKFKAYEKLLTTNDEDEIIKIISSLNESYSSLQNSVLTFASNYSGDTSHIYSNIRSKLKVYTDARERERKENRALVKEQERLLLLAEAKEVIKTFLEHDNFTIAEFCEEYDISEKEFDSCVKIVKEYDEELTKKYNEKILENSKRGFAIISSKINLIVERIKNGIEFNGEIRSFDIIDYYMITKVEFSKIVEVAKKILSSQDFAHIKRFIAQNKVAEKYDFKFEKNILESTTIINVQKDKNGNMIPGTGDIVDIELKQRILNYLKRHNIPINSKTYNTAFKRYMNNELVIDIEEELVLKRENVNS